MDLHLSGKVALVTGVSYGIGRAIAEGLVAENATVHGVSRSTPDPLDGLTHLAYDMSSPDAGERAVASCLDHHGRLDIVVNNVGDGRVDSGFASEDDEAWHRLLELNLMSAIRTTRAALPHLTSTQGVVVNISSVNARLPSTAIYAYSAAKAALDNLTVALAQEFSPQGVRIVAVAPGPVETPLWLGPEDVAEAVAAMGGATADEVVSSAAAGIPIGRFTRPEEVADLVCFLASPRAATITGTVVHIDGGLTPTT